MLKKDLLKVVEESKTSQGLLKVINSTCNVVYKTKIMMNRLHSLLHLFIKTTRIFWGQANFG